MATRNALTLAELVLVLCILVALAGVAIPIVSSNVSDAADSSTRASLAALRESMSDYWRDTKHITLDGVTTQSSEADRFKTDWLFKSPVNGSTSAAFDPVLKQGWNGPYLMCPTGDVVIHNGLVILDAWHKPIVTQYVDPNATTKDVRIVSSGPDGVITISAGTATSALNSSNTGDDIYVALTLR